MTTNLTLAETGNDLSKVLQQTLTSGELTIELESGRCVRLSAVCDSARQAAAEPNSPKPQPGRLKNQLGDASDAFFEPLPESELEAWS